MEKRIMNEVWDEMDDRTGYLYDEILLTQQWQDELSRMTQQQMQTLARGMSGLYDLFDIVLQQLDRMAPTRQSATSN